MSNTAYVLLAYLPTAMVSLGIGLWVGWTERGKWVAHLREAGTDEREMP